MKKKTAKYILFLFTFLFVLFAAPQHTEAASAKTMKKAYTKYMKKVSSKKYFRIVSIGESKKPVLLIARGQSQYARMKEYGETASPYEFMSCDVYYYINGKVKKIGTFENGTRSLTLTKKSGQYYLTNGLSDAAWFGCVKKNKLYVYEYYKEWEKSCVRAAGKKIKNLGYLSARTYSKYKSSYKNAGTIKFMKNTGTNRTKAAK